MCFDIVKGMIYLQSKGWYTWHMSSGVNLTCSYLCRCSSSWLGGKKYAGRQRPQNKGELTLHFCCSVCCEDAQQGPFSLAAALPICLYYFVAPNATQHIISVPQSAHDKHVAASPHPWWYCDAEQIWICSSEWGWLHRFLISEWVVSTQYTKLPQKLYRIDGLHQRWCSTTSVRMRVMSGVMACWHGEAYVSWWGVLTCFREIFSLGRGDLNIASSSVLFIQQTILTQ